MSEISAGIVESHLDRHRRWSIVNPPLVDRLIARRELTWFRGWLVSPWGPLPWIALFIASTLLSGFLARRNQQDFRAWLEVIIYLSNSLIAVSFVIPLMLVIRRRTLRHLDPAAPPDPDLSAADPRAAWPALLIAPFGVVLLFVLASFSFELIDRSARGLMASNIAHPGPEFPIMGHYFENFRRYQLLGGAFAGAGVLSAAVCLALLASPRKAARYRLLFLLLAGAIATVFVGIFADRFILYPFIYSRAEIVELEGFSVFYGNVLGLFQQGAVGFAVATAAFFFLRRRALSPPGAVDASPMAEVPSSGSSDINDTDPARFYASSSVG